MNYFYLYPPDIYVLCSTCTRVEGCTITVIIRLIAGLTPAYEVVLGVMMTELLQHRGEGRQGRMFAVSTVQ